MAADANKYDTSEARVQRNRQLADLGSERRFEITTAEDRDYDPFIGYTERDLVAFRDSVQNAQTFQLQKENQAHLARWSKFHETVEDAEKDLPDLMNGQSHRARLHFEMRNKGAQITTAVQRMAPPQAPRASYMQGFGQDTSAGRASGAYHGPSTSRHKTKSLLDPAVNHSQSPSRSASGMQMRGRAIRIQRRPARRPSHEYIGGLVDPSAWLEDARRKLSSQSDKSTQPEEESVQPIQLVQPLQPTRLEEPVQTIQPVQSVQPSRPEEPTHPDQPNQPTPLKPKSPTRIQPVTNFEKQFIRSNLPRPLTSNSKSQSQAQSQHDPEEDLLLAFDATPEKIQLGVLKPNTVSDLIDLDEASLVDDTVASTTQDNIFRWLQELGVINDTLADFDFSNVNQKKALTERKDQLVTMLNAALTKKNDNSQVTKQHEKKAEPVASPLQKSVKAQLFVPLPKSVGLGASVRRPLGMEASRYAPSRINVDEANDKSKEATDNSIDYWQKTLPKRVSSKQSDNNSSAPLTVSKQQKKVDASPPSKTNSKSLYESRYAC